MTFFPIFVPMEDDLDYILPDWVWYLVMISLIVATIAIFALAAEVVAEMLFDVTIKEKLYRGTWILLFAGMGLLIISLPIVLITGQSAE